MRCSEIEVGATEPVVIDTDRTGQTVTIKIYRHSDNLWLDWDDNTFKAVGSVTTLNQPLSEIDATNAPGLYRLDSTSHPDGLDTSLLGLDPSQDDSLVVIATATSPKRTIPSGEIRLRALVDALVERDTVLSRLNAMARGKIEITGLSPKPSHVATYYQEDDVTVAFETDNKGNVRDPVP